MNPHDHRPGDPHSLSHDIVYSLMVDRHGTLWAGTVDGLNRLEDPVTGRFRSWKADRSSASSQEVPAIIEDPHGVLWLVSQTLQRFDAFLVHALAALAVDHGRLTGRAAGRGLAKAPPAGACQ